MLEHPLSEEEHRQIVQTIEMFEAITQTQPDDYQSLEILKEAYQKVGKHDESLRVSRRLAEAYFNVGSRTNAMQECEAILTKDPNAPDILAMLGEIETRLQASGQAIASAASKNGLTEGSDGSLIDIGSRAGKVGKLANLHERGDDLLAKFLVVKEFFAEEEICKENVERLEAVLSALIDRTKFAYVPLEYYDVDRQIAPMLPDYLTVGRLFVPFDLVSRTLMVACCNPFDVTGREALQQSVDYTVAWYLARPSAIVKNLQSIYRLDARA